MDSKPASILKLQKQLHVRFTRVKQELAFPSIIHDVGYRVGENGEVTGLYFGIDLPKIVDLTFLTNFISLKQLLITGNVIQDLSPIRALLNLESLDLKNTGTTDLTPLKGLTRLKYLNVNLNKITNLEPLSSLIELSYLNIGKNRVSDIEPLRELKNLSWLAISNNEIRDLSAILALPSLIHVELYNNPNIYVDYPPEVIRGGWTALKAYSQNAGKLIVYRNVKVLLLGNSTIGKSSLLKHLEHGKLMECESTHGVVYKQLVFDDITYNFWDFGGQEFFHATHRLFFSQNALNIVLWGEKSNVNPANNLPIEYWVRTVQQLNKDHDSEVLLIENKTDLNLPKYRASPLNQTAIEEKYRNINFNYEAISLADDNRVDVLKLTLGNISRALIGNFKYPGYYQVFKKRIDALNKSVVSPDEINSRPGKQNVTEALKLFHNMGFLLFFPEVLPDKVFARPQELLDLIYNKVLSEDKYYRLSFQQIEESIQGNSLDLDAAELIKLLKYFDLVFEIKTEKNVFFVPQYLPKISSWIQLFEQSSFFPAEVGINADNYLMNLAMQKVFAKYGTFVSKDKDDYIFWNDGIIIEKDGSMLMIKFIREQQRIELYRGQKNESYNLQKEIVDFILDLPEHPDMPKRNFDNHCIKRIREASNENRPSFSPDTFEYLSETSDTEFQSSMEIDYSNETDWISDYFTVSVSLDGEYFIDWEHLAKNKDLTETKIYSHSGLFKIEKTEEFHRYLNMPKPSKSETESPNPIKETSAATNVHFNFNGPVTAGSIGNDNRINEPLISSLDKTPEAEVKKDFFENSQKLAEEKKALRRWKRTAIAFLAMYSVIGLCYMVVLHYEFEGLGSKEAWIAYNASFLSKLINILYPILGGYWRINSVMIDYLIRLKKRLSLTCTS